MIISTNLTYRPYVIICKIVELFITLSILCLTYYKDLLKNQTSILDLSAVTFLNRLYDISSADTPLLNSW